ncbi:MAG: hypothetical protein OSA93_12480 [Akkermansiaceae bacterium]|nr:hypothetical protein [Akkermansiaceae bacterium]
MDLSILLPINDAITNHDCRETRIIEMLEMAGCPAADLFKRGAPIDDNHEFVFAEKIDDRNNPLPLSYE